MECHGDQGDGLPGRFMSTGDIDATPAAMKLAKICEFCDVASGLRHAC